MIEEKEFHVWNLVLNGDFIQVEFEITSSGSLGLFQVDPEKEPYARLHGWTPVKLSELASAYRHGYGAGLRDARRDIEDDSHP